MLHTHLGMGLVTHLGMGLVTHLGLGLVTHLGMGCKCKRLREILQYYSVCGTAARTTRCVVLLLILLGVWYCIIQTK